MQYIITLYNFPIVRVHVKITLSKWFTIFVLFAQLPELITLITLAALYSRLAVQVID